jgi:CDP-glucose 4,6-dehydratase
MDPYWQGRSVFLTGATGFLGQRLLGALLDSGATVAALTRARNHPITSSGAGSNGRLHWVEGILENRELIELAISAYRSDTVLHLAAQSVTGLAMADPVATLETNVRGTWTLLEACRRVGVRAVLVASSGKAYGTAAGLPFKEDAPLRGQTPYDVSKSCADLIATMYARSFGLPVLVLRFANLFGGGDLNFSRLIPGVIRSALLGSPVMLRGSGQAVHDFLYVDDAVDAFLLAARSLGCDPGLSSEAFNFAHELHWTVLEITQVILDLTSCSGVRPVIQNSGVKEGPVPLLDISKARSRLKWSPRYSMEEGLRLTIDWYRAHLCARTENADLAETLMAGFEGCVRGAGQSG